MKKLIEAAYWTAFIFVVAGGIAIIRIHCDREPTIMRHDPFIGTAWTNVHDVVSTTGTVTVAATNCTTLKTDMSGMPVSHFHERLMVEGAFTFHRSPDGRWSWMEVVGGEVNYGEVQ